LVLLVLPCFGQESFHAYYQPRNAEATDLYARKEYAKAIAILEELRQRPELQESDDLTEVLYNLACNYALAGNKERALGILHDAAATGSLSSVSLEQDDDFKSIRGDTDFQKLVGDLKAKERPAQLLWNSSVWNTPYREDLPEAEKIAGLSRLWSEAKFNFAFFANCPGLDWDAQYFAYLPKVVATKSTAEYYRVLGEFYAQLHDGHTGVIPPREVANLSGWPAITTALVEDRVFVNEGRDPALKDRGVVHGVEIIAVDGVPVREYGEKNIAPRIGASTKQDLDARTFENSLLGGLVAKPVALTLRSAEGTVVEVTLPRLSQADSNKLPRTPWKRFEYKVLAGNIAYVALRTFSDNALVGDFDGAFAEIRKADALILDVRNNGGGSSNIGWSILGYLTDRPFSGSQWRTRDYKPSYRAWGMPEKWYGQPASVQSPHGPDPYRKPVVVLTNAHTYSAAEDFAVVFDAMKRGKIVGEPTGGSTGQPLSFPLPGGGSARVCTKHDRYPDGREFVGVGIQPNILVRPTIEDFRAGRDTVLDAAIRELKQ
jgi:C-terminal processing protease CtpA/Prc